MASNLVRSASKLALNRVLFNFTRKLSNDSPMLIKTKSIVRPEYSTSQLTFLNKRFYSSEVKFTPAQVEEKIMDILTNFDRVKENPAKPNVTLESHLVKDLGLDSLDHVEVIVQLEDTFGYEIPDSDYEKLMTPQAMVKYIQKRFTEI